MHNRQPIRCCSIHECLSASIHSVTLSIGSLSNLRSSAAVSITYALCRRMSRAAQIVK